MELALCLVLGLIWGGVWAGLLQYTQWGRFLAERRAWLAVAVGLGVDLLILLAVLPLALWVQVCAVVGVSAVGLVVRSVANEWVEHRALMEAYRSEHADSVGE